MKPVEVVRYRDIDFYLIGTDEPKLEDVEFFCGYIVSGTGIIPRPRFQKVVDNCITPCLYQGERTAKAEALNMKHPEGKRVVIIPA